MTFDAPPPGLPISTPEERTTAALAHGLAVVAGFIAPLVILLTTGKTSAYVRRAAVAALNFQITLAIGWVVAFLLTFVFIGILVMPILGILGIVMPIIGAIRASNGEEFAYPLSLKLVN
jgi:uncharacterized Tic20 family protein